MPSYNKVILMGNLTRDPELRHLPSNMPVAQVGLAVNERYKDKQSGEMIDRANFIDCEAFGRTAEIINQYFQKGAPILIEGKLRLDQWEDRQSGQKRSKLKVVIDRFEFVLPRGMDPQTGDRGGGGGGSRGGRGGGSSGGGGYDDYQEGSRGYGNRGGDQAPANSGPQHEPVDEDDIPF